MEEMASQRVLRVARGRVDGQDGMKKGGGQPACLLMNWLNKVQGVESAFSVNGHAPPIPLPRGDTLEGLEV